MWIKYSFANHIACVHLGDMWTTSVVWWKHFCSNLVNDCSPVWKELWLNMFNILEVLCVCAWVAASVLLVPLQELQVEGHCTNTVVGCVLSGSPRTVGSGSVFHWKRVCCDRVSLCVLVTVQKMSKLIPHPFLNLLKPFLCDSYLQCQRATHNMCNAYSVHGESE